MDFPSCDIFESEGETEKEDQQSLMMKERAGYTVRSCLPCVHPAALVSQESISLKFAGDLAYSQRAYSEAVQYYEKYLRNSTSQGGGIVRDVLESLTRSYMESGDLSRARETYERLVKVGHLQNVLLVRIDLARKTGDNSEEVGATLCHLLEINLSSHRLWLYLADWYRGRGCFLQEFWCIERASNTENSRSVPGLDLLRSSCPLEAETKSEISSRFRYENKRNPNFETSSTEDFVDLGSSIKTKEKEADLNKAQLGPGDDADTIKKFEAKWFK